MKTGLIPWRSLKNLKLKLPLFFLFFFIFFSFIQFSFLPIYSISQFFSVFFTKPALSNPRLSGNADLISGLHFKDLDSPFQVESPFLPSITLNLDFTDLQGSFSGRTHKIDALVSYKILGGDYLDSFGTAFKTPFEQQNSENIDFEQYRLWVRYIKNKFYLRVGKQDIIFGHSKFFRPLAIFDSLNPHDSARESSGEKSLLIKYYPDSSWDARAWSIYGNDSLFHSGLRINRTFASGEAAFTFHEWKNSYFQQQNISTPYRRGEHIFGFDLFIDKEVSYWCELAYHSKRGNSAPLAVPGASFLPFFVNNSYFESSLGMDYTFANIGRGLHLGFEIYNESGLSNYDESTMSALFFDMPVTDFNKLYGSVIFNSDKKQLGFNVRFTRDISENLFGELYFNWSDADLKDLVAQAARGYAKSLIFFENIIALRLRYSF
jgi:hypothetical protein